VSQRINYESADAIAAKSVSKIPTVRHLIAAVT